MSNIDLKALREFAMFQRDDEIGLGVVCHTADTLLAILDRLEEAEKERDALRKAANSVLSWINCADRPPAHDLFEIGRSTGVRVHALAELHAVVVAQDAGAGTPDRNTGNGVDARVQGGAGMAQVGGTAGGQAGAERNEITRALDLLRLFGQYDGAHHKAWVIDQVVRILTGDRYTAWLAAAKAADDRPEYFHWCEGIAP